MPRTSVTHLAAVSTLRGHMGGTKAFPVPQYTFNIPVRLARHVGHMVGHSFSVEWTEEGILFRPLDLPTGSEPLPAWVKNGSNGA